MSILTSIAVVISLLIFLDKGILSFELLYLFTEAEINQMDELTAAGKKFIANEISKYKQSTV